MEPSEYILYNRVTDSSRLILGKNGFKTVMYNDVGWLLPDKTVLYLKIKQISIITYYSAKSYSSFVVTCSTVENPSYIYKLEIKMSEIHKLDNLRQFLLTKLGEKI